MQSRGADLKIGYAGAADPGLRLAAVLDRAEAGQTILSISAADGCDAAVLRGQRSNRAGAPRRCRWPSRLAAGRGVALCDVPDLAGTAGA